LRGQKVPKKYHAPASILAVMTGDRDALKNAPDLLARDSDDRTALIHAAIEGRVDMVAFLLKQGVNPSALDYLGWSALHYAIQSLHAEIASLLMAAGAEVEILEYKEDLITSGLEPHAARAKALTDLLFKRDGKHLEAIDLPKSPIRMVLKVSEQKLKLNKLMPGDYSLSPSKPRKKEPDKKDATGKKRRP
jgi:hypothetical protein